MTVEREAVRKKLEYKDYTGNSQAGLILAFPPLPFLIEKRHGRVGLIDS